MIQITEPITLEKLLPLIKQLPKIEREQLRKTLEEDSTTWGKEWENLIAHFHNAFSATPQDEIERDLALAEVRRERT